MKWESCIFVDIRNGGSLLNSSPQRTEPIDFLFTSYLISFLSCPVFVHGWEQTGFWSVLKYLPMLDFKRLNISFKKEVEEIPAHAKSIIGDDFGMAIPISYLIKNNHISVVVDAYSILKDYFPKKKKRGPNKCPDFLAITNQGKILVIECKGSVSSLSALEDAIGTGKAQKISVPPQFPVAHSLVSGTYVPIGGKNQPILIIDDPEENVGQISNYHKWQFIRSFFAASLNQLGEFELSRAMIQNDITERTLKRLDYFTTHEFRETFSIIDGFGKVNYLTVSCRYPRDIGSLFHALPEFSDDFEYVLKPWEIESNKNQFSFSSPVSFLFELNFETPPFPEEV